MNGKIKRFIFNHYSTFLVIALVLTIVLFLAIPFLRNNLNLLIAWLGTVLSFFYFVQKQELEELKLFKSLYQEFNDRYDKLNEDLNRIYADDSGNDLSPKDKYLLYDYFNLCSEEYLYFTKGYIFPEVWTAWCNGIYFYLKKDRIGDLWSDEEKNAASYYGLTLKEIKSHVKE